MDGFNSTFLIFALYSTHLIDPVPAPQGQDVLPRPHCAPLALHQHVVPPPRTTHSTPGVKFESGHEPPLQGRKPLSAGRQESEIAAVGRGALCDDT